MSNSTPFIQKLFTSRDNNATANTFVGDQDRIWWDPVTNAFYYSDGNTAGGILITGGSTGNGTVGGTNTQVQFNNAGNFGGDPNFTFNNSTSTLTITNIVTTNPIVGGAGGTDTQVLFNDSGNIAGNARFTFDKLSGNTTLTGTAYLGNVLAAANNTSNLGSSTNRFNDLWLGTGNINILDNTLNTPQQIFAQSGNLVIAGGNGIQFGQFAIFGNTISTINPTANINIGLVGSTGYVDIERPVAVNSTGGGLPAFVVEQTGTVQIYNSNAAANTSGALNIVGSLDRSYQPVTNSGGMLHITGPGNSASRVNVDAFGVTGTGAAASATFTGRAARGAASAPAQSLANDITLRLGAVSWKSTGGWTGSAVAGHTLDFVALEDATDASHATAFQFFNAANGGGYTRYQSAQIQSNGLSFLNNTTANSGITFHDGTFQNTAYISTNVVNSLTAGAGIALSSTTGNITIQNTGVLGIVGTANQISVTGNVGNVVTLGTPQDIAPTSNVQFNNLTVNNLSVIGNISNTIPIVVNGPIVYVANSATTYNGINNSGISTGNIANNYYASILYNTTSNTWKTNIGNSVGITAGNIYTDNMVANGSIHLGNAYNNYDFTNALLQGDTSADTYSQFVLKNHSQTANASADIVAVANNGDDNVHYIDMGINSNVYANVDYAVTGANDGYLYVNGGNLVIGTQTAAKTINFFTGGTSSTSYLRGTLSDSGLSMTGNVTANNMISTSATIGGTVSATGNITGGNLLIPTGIVSVSGNVNALNLNATVVSATGNIVGPNVRVTGTLSALGNVVAGNLTTSGIMSSVGNLIAANISSGNITSGIISATGNITGPNITATVMLVSSLLSVTGNIQAGNLLTVGIVSATGNVIANTFIGNGSQLTGITLARIANGTSNVAIATSSGNATIDIGGTPNVAVFATTGEYVTGVVSATGNITGGNILTGGLASVTGNISGGNLAITGISNLNSNANVKISGGIAGQSLATDGTGNLFWTSGTGGNTIIINGTSSNTVNIDFTYNSTTLLYLPTGNVNVTLANYTAGHTARVIVRYGAPYPIAMGVANVQQTTEGSLTIPISGAGGHKINGNQSVQLLYTCFDNTAANCYVASTFL